MLDPSLEKQYGPSMVPGLVTLGITCYNAEKTIRRAVESALEYTGALELLIVDDVSTDGSIAEIEKLIAEGKPIRLVRHKENGGVAAARQTLIEHARGEFIAFLDSDDACIPGRIEKQRAKLLHAEAEYGTKDILCFGHRLRLFADGRREVVEAMGDTKPEPHGEMVADYILAWQEAPGFSFGPTGAGALFARTETLKKYAFDPKFRRAEELDLVVRVSLAGGRIVSVNESVVTQYISEGEYKSHTANLRYYRLLREKHRDYLRRKNLYHFGWFRVRSALAKYHGRKLESFGFMTLASLIRPRFFLEKIQKRMLAPDEGDVKTGALKEKIFSGSLWSFLGSGGNQIFGFLVFIVLSHQLSPGDFGVMAMAMVFAETMNPLVRFGLSAGLIRQKEISETSANTVFWMTLATGLFYTVLLWMFAPGVADALDMEALEDVLRWLAPLPTLYALSTVHEATFEHGYRFKALAKRVLVASGISGVAAVAMALGGFGLYALVFQKLVSAALLTLVLWIESPWRPRFIFARAEAKALLKEGIPLMISSFFVTLNSRMKDFLVGLFLGAAALGFLRVASKLNDFVVQFTVALFTNVSLTTFSKLQEDKQALRRMYQQLTQACGMLAFPAFFGMAAVAPEFVPFVFGEQWQPSAFLMQLLCLATLSSTLNYFYKPLMISLGLAGRALRINAIEVAVTAVIITAAAQVSLPAVVLGEMLCYTIVTVITLRHIRGVLELDVSKFLSGFVPPLLASVMMALSVLLLDVVLARRMGLGAELAVLIPAGVVFYVGAVWLLFPAYATRIRESMLPLVMGVLKKKVG